MPNDRHCATDVCACVRVCVCVCVCVCEKHDGKLCRTTDIVAVNVIPLTVRNEFYVHLFVDRTYKARAMCLLVSVNRAVEMTAVVVISTYILFRPWPVNPLPTAANGPSKRSLFDRKSGVNNTRNGLINGGFRKRVG